MSTSYRAGLVVALAMLLPSAPLARSQNAELILYNGRVATVDAQFSIAEAVAIGGGKILAVGTDAEVRALAGGSTEQVDLRGRLVTPGFVDAHPHLVHIGSGWFTSVSLQGARSIVEVQERIAAKVAESAPGEWIAVTSLGDPPPVADLPGALEEKRWPNKHDLDAVAPRNPVVIPTPWGGPKPAILNSSALLRLGITKETPAHDQGLVIEKGAGGEPTGIVHRLHVYYWNPYVGKLSAMLPSGSLEEQRRGVAQEIALANASGLTAINETHFVTSDNIKVFDALQRDGKLNMRVGLAYEISGASWQPAAAIDGFLTKVAAKIGAMEADATVTRPGTGRNRGWRGRAQELDWIEPSDSVRINAVNLSLDGPLSFGTAAMHVDYRDLNGDDADNELPLDADKIAEIAGMAAEKHLKMYFVIGGDRMADVVLDAIERVNETTPVKDLGWVLNHVSFATKERIERVRRLGLMVTSYTASEYGRDQAEYTRVFGPEASARYVEITTPFGWWLDAGVDVAFGTDSAANPMFTMWHALTRKNRYGESLMTPGKKITRAQALKMATIHGARVMGWNDKIGSIVNGKLADLVIHDVDLLTCTDDEIASARPAATLVGGRVVYGSLR